MRIVLLGAPGVGKGTQSQFLTKKYGIPHLSTGDIIRTFVRSQSELGKESKQLMDAGKLVKDEIVISLIKERIHQDYCRKGFLLDGFPPTILQAKAMKQTGIFIDYVLEFTLPDELIINRIIGRQVHIPSGRIYHVKFNPPKRNGKDDITNEPLSTRNDDEKETIYHRLLEYHQHTIPVIEYYRQEAAQGNIGYYTIDVIHSINKISAKLSAIFDSFIDKS